MNNKSFDDKRIAQGYAKDRVNYQMQHEFDIDAFIRFMMIQSNVNSQIQSGHKAKADIES